VFYSITSRRKSRPDEFKEDMATVFGFLRDRAIHSVVVDRLPLAGAREAHERIDAGGLGRKIVLLAGDTRDVRSLRLRRTQLRLRRNLFLSPAHKRIPYDVDNVDEFGERHTVGGSEQWCIFVHTRVAPNLGVGAVAGCGQAEGRPARRGRIAMLYK
jgi:hypothetical protein